MSKIVCLLCNKEFNQITATHLKKEHGFSSLNEYRLMFPKAPIITKEVSERLSNLSRSRTKNSDFGFKKGISHNKGKPAWNKGLTKETDSRVAKYAGKLKGRKLSDKTKALLSESKTKHTHYNFCQNCLKPKSNTTRELCINCARQKLVNSDNYHPPMSGTKLSEEHKEKLLKSTRGVKEINKPEKKVMNSYFDLEYVGNRKLWLKFLDGTSKNPDIVIKPLKIAIEIFGDYWHKNEDPQILIDKYKEIGWRCLVLWEKEINKTSEFGLSEVINQFINYDNYEPYTFPDEPNYGQRYILKSGKDFLKSIEQYMREKGLTK